MTFIANVFPKRRLYKYLKSAVSQYLWTSNIIKSLKHVLNHRGAPLSYLLITDKDIEFEKVTLSDKENVMTVC